MKLLLLLASLVFLASGRLHAAEPARVSEFEVQVDGTIKWDGQLLTSDPEILATLLKYRGHGPRRPLHLFVKRRTPNEAVDHATRLLEQSDCCILGVVNTNTFY